MDACGQTANENCTYIRNPNFDGQPSTCSYNIEKSQDDICQLRLDFITFEIHGPNDVIEVNGGSCNVDNFIVDAPNGINLVPVICGVNTGQHSE